MHLIAPLLFRGRNKVAHIEHSVWSPYLNEKSLSTAVIDTILAKGHLHPAVAGMFLCAAATFAHKLLASVAFYSIVAFFAQNGMRADLASPVKRAIIAKCFAFALTMMSRIAASLRRARITGNFVVAFVAKNPFLASFTLKLRSTFVTVHCFFAITSIYAGLAEENTALVTLITERVVRVDCVTALAYDCVISFILQSIFFFGC